MNTSNEIKLDSKDGTPLYLQLARNLESNIYLGMFHANEAIPPERTLSESLNISRFTARKAIDVLCERGLLTRKHGSGTYVNSRAPQLLTHLVDFDEAAQQRNLRPGSIWISRETTYASRTERRHLELAANSLVTRLKRLRTENDVVVAIENTIIPARYLPDLTEKIDSIYAYLKRSNFVPARARQYFGAINATVDQAKLMNLKPGDAVFHTKRVGYLQNGEAIELTHTFYRSDACDFMSIMNARTTPANAGLGIESIYRDSMLVA
ncbi:MAG TPA: GntR family transcriptional regulator [Burkholderiaceae bacterium]